MNEDATEAGWAGTRPVLLRPSTVDEALAALDTHRESATLVAGGQSLIPMMSAGLVRPEVVIDLGAIEVIEPFWLEDDTIAIGLGCTHRQLELAPPWLAAAAPLVVAAAPWIGSLAIRNRGTFIGSLAHGDPSSEWPAVAMALDVEVEVASSRGRRREPIHDFLLGPMATTIDSDEILLAARFARADADATMSTGAAVVELTYRHGDYAVVGVAAQLAADRDGTLRRPRLAVFGIGDVPWRAREVEAVLDGATAPDLRAAGDLAADLVTTVSDATASAEYRRRMTGVMVRRALAEAWRRASSGRGSDGARTDDGTGAG